ICNLYRRCNVLLFCSCGQQRKIPPLVLEEAGNGNVAANPPFGANEDVTKTASLQEHAVHYVAAVSGLNCSIGGEPVCALQAKRDALAANCCVAENVARVGIAIEVADVPVEKTTAQRLEEVGNIGNRGFRAKIQLRQSGKLRKVNSRIVRRLLRIANWSGLVL